MSRSASPDPLLDALAPPPGPVLVGFSGGLDSTVLLHALARSPGQRRAGLRAIHVDHGLQPASADWAAHCRAACAALDVPLLVVPVAVDAASGLGIEGAARQARRAAFAWVRRVGGRGASAASASGVSLVADMVIRTLPTGGRDRRLTARASPPAEPHQPLTWSTESSGLRGAGLKSVPLV